MFVVYIDESGKDQPVTLVGGLVVMDGAFHFLEAMTEVVAGLVGKQEMPEFHASDLFNGYGVFKLVSQETRLDAVRLLLHEVRRQKLPFVYAAVQQKELQTPEVQQHFGSANPVDVAFQICALGVEDFIRNTRFQYAGVIRLRPEDLCLYVFDETQELKKSLRTTFRRLRPRPRFQSEQPIRLLHAFDELYFSDSSQSVGIQLADLCGYFVRRKILGKGPDEFYDLIKDLVTCAKPSPEWTQFRQLFRSHEDAPRPSVWPESAP